MNLSLRDLRLLSGVAMSGGAIRGTGRIGGVSTDSRSVKKGDLFIALRGEKYDGHAFIDSVIGAGAIGVVVDRRWAGTHPTPLPVPAAVVPDTTIALGELAGIHRRRFSIPVIAVGGSNGKTTTKELIRTVLEARFSVLATEGNLNNHIGMPQMLFRLRSSHEIAVLELGTNHFGELQTLCRIAEPTHALITNIGREHLEFFGDEEGVAREETELYRSMRSRGFGFVNIDDGRLKKAAGILRKKLTYGTSRNAQVRAANVSIGTDGSAAFELKIAGKKRSARVTLGVPGPHNVTNALAAAAVGLKFGVPLRDIAAALGKFRSTQKRMEVISHNGITILNDTYNANPDSVLAALKALQALQIAGKKIVVLGDMLELGAKAEHEHAKIGLAVSDMDFEYLLTFGKLARYTYEASKLPFAEHFDTKAALIASLKAQLQPGDAVLVKGSRGMKMEEVVAQL